MCVLLLAACAKSQHTVAYDGTVLSLDAHPVQISAVRFHYWQWPSSDSWPAALRELHSRGYNTIALDLFWGYHSARPGSYDFTGIRDIDKLLDDAAREGLYVGVEAGPYTDSGGDAGGLPDWILAHTASRATLKARFLRESREWLAKADAIVRRHQLDGSGGTVVLYHVDAGALANAASFERATRRDGITVPFGSLHPSATFSGFAWGWTTAPNVVASDATRSNRSVATDTSAPVPLPRWRSRRDDLEILPGFEDQAWPPLLAAGQFDADDNDDDDAAPAKSDDDDDKHAPPARFFGVDDYGFHHGSVWYRGHFAASGNERHFALSGISGASGACTVWLNGTYLGSLVAGRAGTVRGTLPIPKSTLRVGPSNVISVAFENTGHDADPYRDVWRAQPRGMLSAALQPATTIAWHVLGNGEYNVDSVRGPLNSGGLAGEIAGWQNPAFSDAGWPPTRLPLRAAGPGIVWYRAKVTFPGAPARGRIGALRLAFSPESRYRAFVFCNGWMLAHLTNDDGPTHVVPLPPGIVRGPTDNEFAIVVWTLAGRSAIEDASVTTVKQFAN